MRSAANVSVSRLHQAIIRGSQQHETTIHYTSPRRPGTRFFIFFLHNIYKASLSGRKSGIRHNKSARSHARREETDRARRFQVAAVSAVVYNLHSGHPTQGRMSEEDRRCKIMEIDDTIQTLATVRQSIDAWVPQITTRPDVLIADLNDLYVESTENRSLDELFEYSDVGSPSITLSIGIDVDFDLKRVMENMRTRLQILQPGRGMISERQASYGLMGGTISCMTRIRGLCEYPTDTAISG